MVFLNLLFVESMGSRCASAKCFRRANWPNKCFQLDFTLANETSSWAFDETSHEMERGNINIETT